MKRYASTSPSTVIWTLVMPLNSPNMKPVRSSRCRSHTMLVLTAFMTLLLPRGRPSTSLLPLPLTFLLVPHRNAATPKRTPVITHQRMNLLSNHTVSQHKTPRDGEALTYTASSCHAWPNIRSCSYSRLLCRRMENTGIHSPSGSGRWKDRCPVSGRRGCPFRASCVFAGCLRGPPMGFSSGSRRRLRRPRPLTHTLHCERGPHVFKAVPQNKSSLCRLDTDWPGHKTRSMPPAPIKRPHMAAYVLFPGQNVNQLIPLATGR
jgi:hypothetical protein